MTLRSGEVFFAEQSDSFIIPESISLFGLSVSFYGILLVLAALVGIIAVTEFTRRLRRNQEWTLTLVTLVILSALLGGRLYYVLFEWQKFAREPLMLLNLRSGGLSYFGALFGAWFAVKGYCRKKDKDFLQSAEVLCFGAAAAAPFGVGVRSDGSLWENDMTVCFPSESVRLIFPSRGTATFPCIR